MKLIIPIIVGLLINVDNAQQAMPMKELPISITVTPAVCLADCNIRVEVVIPPRLENRLAVLVVDGPMYFSSDIQLDGANAKKRFTFTYSSLSAGEYEISATLKDSSRTTSRVVFTLTVKENQ